jgi:hypothetical protein
MSFIRECFDGYTGFYDQLYLSNTTITEHYSGASAYECQRLCADNTLCGGFNYLVKQSQCYLLLTDTFTLLSMPQQSFAVFYMQSFNTCDGTYYNISPFYLVGIIITILLFVSCFWMWCCHNRTPRRIIFARSHSDTPLIETPSPSQIPPAYQAIEAPNTEEASNTGENIN